jgi:thioredoxin 1
MASEKIHQVTDTNWEQAVLKSQTPVLVDFWAEWCMPCRRIAPTVDQLATEYDGRLTVAKMNVDENPSTPTQLGVRGIPTLMLFKGGNLVDALVGAADKETIRKMVEKHLG